ncbi:MAG TPA: LCP family protein, partial [Limnochordia bacterium]
GIYIYQRSLVAGAHHLIDLAGPDGRLNVLVIGDDKRRLDAGRADTLMIASFDPAAGRLTLLSVPRDTRVHIPGLPGYRKINEAVTRGGAELARQTVTSLLGVHVDYYVLVDFEAFEKLIDAIGGVMIDVEKPMKYVDRGQNLTIDLDPGRQVLNGREALQYVRFRADSLGDVALVVPGQEIYDGRVARQLKFARALARKVLSPATLLRLPHLVTRLYELVETDLPLQTMVSLAIAARRIDPSEIETALVPGVGEIIDGVSYWMPDLRRTDELVAALFGPAGSAPARREHVGAAPVAWAPGER